jgi:putative transposase
VTVESLCGAVGMSRQNYYKDKKSRSRRRVDEEAVLALVRRERALQPRLGVRKLHTWLSAEWASMGVVIGRDRLFEMLGRHGLLVHRKRRRPRTTDSRHGFRVYANLLMDLVLKGPHEAWVSDITYLRTDEGWLYLSLISDAYSRQIVGYEVSESLAATGSLRALKMAIAQLPPGARPLHHSDRGVQYCCRDYITRLETMGIAISMTEVNHCYENAQAERLNGILKDEYGLGDGFRTRAQAIRAVDEAVGLFNTRRPHTSLGYQTPSAVHKAA